MLKNRFCTFTLAASLALAALPATLAAAGEDGGTTASSVSSLPTQQSMSLTIEPSGSDTYNPKGSSFTAYRVMSFTRGSDGNWTWDTVNGFTYPGTGSFNADAFGSYPASRLQNLAEQLALQVNDSMTDKLPQTALENGSLTWTTDNAGIYLVCETQTAAGNFPSKPFLVALPYTDETNDNSWKYELTARPKGSRVGLQKVIHNAKGSYSNTVTYDGKKDTVANGDEVEYRISTRIPSYTSVYFEGGKNPTFRLTDTMAKGLTLTPATVRLTNGEDPLTKDTDYTQTCSTDSDGITTLTISLAGSYLEVPAHQNTELVLSYSATVNSNVSLADNGNQNVVTLDYSYDPADPDDTSQVQDDAVVYSFGIEVEKFDGDSEQKTKLSGAQFELYKEADEGTAAASLSQAPYRPAGQTGDNGIVDFKGLDAGTYYLKEVKAPHGYSLLMNPIKVEIIPDSSQGANEQAQVINSGSFTVKVNGQTVSKDETSGGVTRILNETGREETVIVAAANHKGFSLPSTGGTGIILILLASAAGLVLVTLLFVRGDRKRNITGTKPSV